MKRKTIIILTVSIVFSVAGILLLNRNVDLRKLERRIEIDLPESSEIVFSQNDIGWFGEGAIITVLDVDEDEIDDFFLLLSNGKPSEEFTQEEFEIEMEHLINTFLIDLPEDQKPNWENEYDWVDENDYYIYDFVTEKLYIIEVEW
jgi:hypothetical protein